MMTGRSWVNRMASVLVMFCLLLFLLPAGAFAEEPTAVTLDLSNGKIVIYPDGYSQGGSAKVSYTGAYIITGSRTDDTALRIENSGEGVTYDITLENATIKGDIWCTAFVINGSGSATVNLYSKGTSSVMAHNHAALARQQTVTATVKLQVLSGTLELGAEYYDTARRVYDGLTFETIDCTSPTAATLDNSKNTVFRIDHLEWLSNEDEIHICAKCGYEEAHTMQRHSYDDSDHTLKCTTCNRTVTEAHTWTLGDVITPPGEGIVGEQKAACDVCKAEKTCSIAPTNAYLIQLGDGQGDGWDGAELQVFVNGEEDSTITIDSGDTYEVQLPVPAKNEIVKIKFLSGEKDEECAVKIYAPGTTEPAYQQDDFSRIEDGTVIFTINAADYTAVEDALAKVPSDLAKHTEESVKALNDAIDAVDWEKPAGEQAVVDAYAEAILAAIDGLVLKADYSKVEAALAKVPQNLKFYTAETVAALEEAIANVEYGYGTDRQDEVDQMAKAIEDAIAGLVELATPPTGDNDIAIWSVMLCLSATVILSCMIFLGKKKTEN